VLLHDACQRTSKEANRLIFLTVIPAKAGIQ